MAPETPRRPKRNPLSAEEVAQIIALRKKRAHIRLIRFKKSHSYRWMNIFNVACFCLFFELLCCFIAVCSTAHHVIEKVSYSYGGGYKPGYGPEIAEMKIETRDGRIYELIVNDFTDLPAPGSSLITGRDFLLGKELKARLESSDTYYRLLAASPALLLSALVLCISLVAFIYNLNEDPYSLMALTVLNGLTLLGVIFF